MYKLTEKEWSFINELFSYLYESNLAQFYECDIRRWYGECEELITSLLTKSVLVEDVGHVENRIYAFHYDFLNRRANMQFVIDENLVKEIIYLVISLPAAKVTNLGILPGDIERHDRGDFFLFVKRVELGKLSPEREASAFATLMWTTHMVELNRLFIIDVKIIRGGQSPLLLAYKFPRPKFFTSPSWGGAEIEAKDCGEALKLAIETLEEETFREVES